MDLMDFILELAEAYIEYQSRKIAYENIKELDANIKKFLQTVDNKKRRLTEFNIVVPQDLPETVFANLQEAINCYTLGLDVAAYALILRTIELAVHYYHELFFPNKDHTNFKKMIDDLNKKTTIEKTLINFMGAQYQERNKVIHTLYRPSELELLYAFESTIRYVTKLNKMINYSRPQLPDGRDKYLDD